jgi:hypothetical protein
MPNEITVDYAHTSAERTIGPAHPAYQALSKTETKLLRGHQEGRICVESSSGRGPNGGNVCSGRRDQDAARKLVAKGFIERIINDTYTMPDGGYTVTVVRNVFRVITFLS